jgi:haloalkane dehalogenase
LPGKEREHRAPTHLHWGGDDEFAPVAGAKRFEREIPGSKLVVVDGAGHFVIDEQRERCAQEIALFLVG